MMSEKSFTKLSKVRSFLPFLAILILVLGIMACNLTNLTREEPYQEPAPGDEEPYQGEPPEGEPPHKEGDPEHEGEPPKGEEHTDEVRIEFEAERTHLAPGECTLLFWHVEGGGFDVFLNGEPVERVGEREICLDEPEVFVLAVDMGGEMEERVIEIFTEGEPGEGHPPEDQPPEGEPPKGHEPEEPPPGEPEMSDEEAIKQALLDELGWSEAELQFDIAKMDDRFAEGGVSRGGELGGAMWLAAKDHSGGWVIVHHGQDLPPCGEVDAYNIPPDWVPYCWDEASGTSIER